jgi:hypothetical protein
MVTTRWSSDKRAMMTTLKRSSGFSFMFTHDLILWASVFPYIPPPLSLSPTINHLSFIQRFSCFVQVIDRRQDILRPSPLVTTRLLSIKTLFVVYILNWRRDFQGLLFISSGIKKTKSERRRCHTITMMYTDTGEDQNRRSPQPLGRTPASALTASPCARTVRDPQPPARN